MGRLNWVIRDLENWGTWLDSRGQSMPRHDNPFRIVQAASTDSGLRINESAIRTDQVIRSLAIEHQKTLRFFYADFPQVGIRECARLTGQTKSVVQRKLESAEASYAQHIDDFKFLNT